jgi:signal transduction histidine kinase
MTPLPEFMELNRNIILFLYGLVFFSLGIILALQSRSYSRLDLARSLKWLAAFGIIHGIYEWESLFIPLQSSNLSDESIRFWNSVQVFFLAVSFACLFKFGLSLLKSPRWIQFLPLAILGIWTLIVFGLLLALPYDQSLWRNTGNALARYMLSFPAGLIAAYSLRRYTLERITVLNAPHIIKYLRIAGFSLFFYAFFSGLIVPPVNFFPGSMINNQTFVDVFTLPALVFRSTIGLVLAMTMIRALEIFDIEYARRIEALEQQQIMNGERERIARELHDGTLQTVYTAGLLVESAAHIAEADSQIAERLERAVAALNHAIQDLRHSLTELKTEKTSESVAAALKDMLREEQFESLIHLDLSVNLPDTQELSPIRMDHLLAITREALANVIRHAQAQSASVEAFLEDHIVSVIIADNGIGFPTHLSPGYGLRNMRDRARMLGGDLDIRSETGRGTSVILKFPVVES